MAVNHDDRGADARLRTSLRHRLRTSVALALPLAIVATFLVVPPASAAATVTAGSILKTDGTAPFDGAAGAGNDTGANNGVVRTFDFTTYAVTIGNSGLGNNINNTTVTATLPVGMVWSALDGTCLTSSVTPVSSISSDRRTITCNIGSRLAGSLVELPLVAYPLGTVPNGTTKTVDFTVAYNDPGSANARLSMSGGSVEVTVSAGKNPDLSHNDNVAPVSGQAYSSDYTYAATSSTIAGTVTDNSTPLAAATVALFDTNDNPLVRPGTSTPFSTTTDGSGNYSFTGVPAGTVRTRVTAGAPVGTVPAGPMSYLNTVQGQALDNDFDFVTPAAGSGPATVSGVLFHDNNLNGVDNSEPGIDRVTLTLTGYGYDGNPVSRSVDTASDGSYSFSVPPSGPNGYKIVASGRKVAKYLPVVTNEYNVHVGDAQTKTVNLAWSTDTNRGKNFVSRFPIALKAPASGKGVASLAGPITWTETVPAGATVASCGRVGQNGTQFYFLPGGTGGGTNSVVNSGTWTCAQPGGAGTPITVTVNGADTSGTTFPTRNQYNQTLPADARYLAVGYVAIAQSDPGCGASIASRTVSSSGFSATDVGGNPLADAYPQTDTLTAAALPSGRDCTPLAGRTGWQGFDKRFTKDESHGWATASNDDLYYLNSNLHNSGGNANVPATAPFGSTISTYNSSDIWDTSNILACDKFDQTRFKLINRIGVSPATPFALTVTNPQSPFANRLLRQYSSTAAFDAASATSGAFIVEFGVGTPYASLAAQRSATCDDAITWHAWDPSTPVDQADLDGAIVYRIRAKAFQPGDNIRVRAAMIAKPTPGGTYASVGLNPLPSPDTTLANTLGGYVTYGDGTTTSQPNYLTRYADPGNGIVRVNKYDSAASSSTTLTSAVSGNTVGQTIYVTANGVYPDSGLTMGNVKVVDTLPAGLGYVAGSANPAPTSVLAGGSGTTIVTWELGNLSTDTGTATITYQATVSPDVSTGSTLTNTAVVSSPDDPSPVNLRTDSHQLAITANAEFKIFKETPDPRVEPDDTFRYRLGYKNLSATSLASQDFIDVLPYSGDGRTTAYSGGYTLDTNTADPIVANSPSDRIYVTTAAPGSITRDPRAAVNALPSTGAVTWCLVPDDLGTAGCPTDIHDGAITALRVTSDTAMPMSAPTRYVDVRLRATGDSVGDKFGNNFAATGAGLGTYVQSNAPVVDVQRGTVSNLVWHDLNSNGRQDSGEPGLSGVQVTLTGKDYVWDGSAYVVRNDYDATPLVTTTNGSGQYSFTDLNHGTFTVHFPTTTGGLSLTKQDNATDITDSDPDPTTGDTAEFCLGEAPDAPGTGTCPDYTGLEANQTQWDAGYAGTGYVGDLVWADTNGDGQKQGGESGLVGWDVALVGPGADGLIDTTDDDVVGSTQTDSNGTYGFGGLAPGPYRVQITPANGWSATRKDSGSDTTDSDVDPATNRILVVAQSGATNLSYDAGYYRPTGFGDRVWIDDDADGIQDGGELDLEGVRVDLLDNSSNPVTNSLGQPIFTTTDADGYYEFTNLRAGTYKARFTKPFGYAVTTQRASGGANGAGAADDSDADRNGIATVTLASGDPFLADVDAGMFKPVTIGDKVWADTDRDGTQDPGEPGVSGVTVGLYDQTGSAVLNTSGTAYTTTTDSAGRYAFTDLFPKPASNPSDYYRVRFTLPSGYKWTGTGPITAPDQTSVPTTGADLTDSDTTWSTRGQSTASSGKIYLSQSETNGTVDAGVYRPAQIGNYVWRDDDADGIQDSTETGQTGVTVSLLQRTGLGTDGVADTGDDVYDAALDDDGATVASTTTGSSGAYSFTNLATGTYRVRFEWTGPAHLAPTTADTSSDAIDDVDSDAIATATTRRAETGPVALTYGDTNNDADAGFTPTSAIGDKVWEDVDGDGIQDAGEPGVSGAEVTLWTAGVDATFGTGDDAQVLVDANAAAYGTGGTITTDSSGAYLFDDLAPGTYQVRVRTPGSSWRPTAAVNAGSPALANDDSDIGTLAGDGRTASTDPVALAPLDRVLKIDAGLFRVSSIGDEVFTDADGDGIQDGGETGVAGAGVTLWTAGADTSFGTGDDVQVTADADGTVFGTAGTVATPGSGAYSFGNLRPGAYQVRVAAPSAHVLTVADAGSDDAADSDAARTTPSTGVMPPRTLASNTTVSDLDAGVYIPARFGTFVWVDADGDGIQDAGEPGLAGATMTLLDGSDAAVTTDAQGNAISPLVTGSNGAYQFGDLPPGTYKVQVDLPAGYLHTQVGAGSDAAVDSDIDASTHRSDALTLPSGGVDETIDAGAYRAVTIGNRVWDDTNADGTQDAGETTGIPGVGVDLVQGSTVVASTTTDSSGNYGFSRLGSNQADSAAALLPPGTYRVRFHRPNGWVPSPSSGTDVAVATDSDVVFSSVTDATADTSPLAISENTTEPDVDAGFFRPAKIGDRIWEDLNGDGDQDAGEPGLAGVTVSLVDQNGDTVVDVGGDDVTDVTTASDGAYVFDGLRPGRYRILVTFDDSVWVVTGRDLGGNDAKDSDVAVDGVGELLTVVSGSDVTNNDAGLYHTIVLGDLVFEDRDGDGVQDAGEPGVASVPVALDGADGLGTTVHRTTTSDFAGKYEFRDLAPGTYHVTVLPLSGWTATVQDQGADDAVDSDIDPSTLRSADTVLTSYEIDRTWDAGLVQAPLVSGHVYIDADDDGVRDPGEEGRAAVTVALTGTDSLGHPITRSTTTDATGTYVFASVPPSDNAGYTVTETQPAGLLDGRDAVGSAGGLNTTNDQLSGIVVRSGTTAQRYDFGELRPSSVSGIAYVDTTGNGTVDAGEPRLGGVTITLTGTDDLSAPVSSTTTTGADGTFDFGTLRPGSYSLAGAQPPGYSDGPERAGTSGGSIAVNDVIGPITLPQGTSATGYLFGERPSAPIGYTSLDGTVWRDPNRNGVHDADETGGVPGVTVRLTRPDGSPAATTTTDSNGHYAFTGFATGDYVVEEAQPAGWKSTSPDSLGSSGSPLRVPAAGLRNQDFFEDRGRIAGAAFSDDDNDGVRDAGETGISGVTVTLTGTDVDGHAVNRTAVTSASGAFRFTDLVASDSSGYTITETQPSGWTDGTDATGLVDGAATGHVADDVLSAIVLPVGGDGAGYTFGEIRPAGGAGTTFVSGHVYLDGDRDGELDAGESGLGGVTVQLLDHTSAIVGTKVTSTDGAYAFTGLAPGSYTLREIQPSGYTSTTPDDLGPSTVPLTGLADQDFGERLPGNGSGAAWVAGHVFMDRDNDGTIDLGEPGLGAVTITLRDSFGTAIGTVATDAAGQYRFEHLAPGDYVLDETQPTGLASSTPNSLGPVSVPLDGLEHQDFGERPASISGSVFVDLDHDGVRDGGEVGIAGATVTLTGTDAASTAVNRTTVTDVDGRWTFGDVVAGTYVATETQPAGHTDGLDHAGSAGGTLANDVISAIVVTAGSAAVDYDFGETAIAVTTPPGTSWLTGLVFFDRDRDSATDPGETPLAGVIVEIRDAGAVLVGTTLTGSDGRYTFTGLTPGAAYSVTETDPTGYGSSFNPTAAPATAPAAGTGAEGPHFGDVLAELGGAVFDDADRDGVHDGGEAGIVGVLLTLSGTDATGATVARTTHTASDGTYRFDDLLAGTYRIGETQPWGYLDGAEVHGSIASDTSTNDAHASIVLPSGVVGTALDFGEQRAPSVTTALSGRVFQDRGPDGTTANGTYEPGEPGLGGVTLVLRDVNDVVVATTVTASNGTYLFSGMATGTYSVTMLQPAGYGTSTPTVRSSLSVPLVGLDDVDFGVTLGSVRGVVFSDIDDDGHRDAGEPGIAGTTVALTGTDAFGNAVSESATTDADGRFAVVDLLGSDPTGYTVTETQPGGWLDGLDASPLTGIGGDDQFTGIVVDPGRSLDVGTFGEVAGVRLGDRVWDDANGNGVQNDGESGVGGIVVRLTGTTVRGATVDRSATTDGDGAYGFADLRPGTYEVALTPADRIVTYRAVGTDRAVDSDVDRAGRSDEVVVVGNTTLATHEADRLDLDAGVSKGALIRGRLYKDGNKSGTRNAGEANGTCDEVRLTPAGPDRAFGSNDDPSVVTTKPAADGTYEFGPVLPGRYRIGSDCSTTVEVEVLGEQIVNDVDLPIEVAPNMLAFSGQTVASFLGLGALLIGAGVVLLGTRPRFVRRRLLTQS